MISNNRVREKAEEILESCKDYDEALGKMYAYIAASANSEDVEYVMREGCKTILRHVGRVANSMPKAAALPAHGHTTVHKVSKEQALKNQAKAAVNLNNAYASIVKSLMQQMLGFAGVKALDATPEHWRVQADGNRKQARGNLRTARYCDYMASLLSKFGEGAKTKDHLGADDFALAWRDTKDDEFEEAAL